MDADYNPLKDKASSGQSKSYPSMMCKTAEAWFSVPYSHWDGLPEMSLDETQIIVQVKSRKKLLVDGKPLEAEGNYNVIIRGKRLHRVYKDISFHKMPNVEPTKDNDGAVIESVEIVAVEE